MCSVADKLSSFLFMSLTLFHRSHLIQVVLSDHNIFEVEGFEQRFNVSLVIRHYQYSYWMLDNDIMLLKVRNDSRVAQGMVVGPGW